MSIRRALPKQPNKKLRIVFSLLVIFSILAPALIYLPDKVFAATCEWSGGSGNWEDSGNWTNCGGGVPGAADDVIIDASVTVDINGTTTINSLTLGNAGGTTTAILNFDYDAISGGALIIDDGDFTLNTGAILSHTVSTTATVAAKINIDVQSGNADLDGSVSLDNKGFVSPYGEGSGTVGVYRDGAGGGGNGGEGGSGESGILGGMTTGSVSAPITLGSGGGEGDIYPGIGGIGGGVIKLSATDIALSGTISANGEQGNSGSSSYPGGGGAGGSVWLIASDELSGNGSITVNGGAGRSVTYAQSGGGGGGRIAMEYASYTFSGTLQAYGGDGPSNATAGGAGTIYTRPTAQSSGNLLIYNGALAGYESTNISSGTFYNVTIDNATLSHSRNDDAETYQMNITVENNLSVDTDGAISVDARGYSAGNGPGAGGEGAYDYGSAGGAYGGESGIGSDTSARSGSYPYGSLASPFNNGSGAGNINGTTVRGGAGGGTIKLTINGTLDNEGTISANGQEGDAGGIHDAPGGGSGGSVWLIVDTLTGSGDITANGANGETESYAAGGGGSGGRISITYDTNNLSGSVTAYGGSSSGSAKDGGAGTICYKPSGQTYCDLVVDNGSNTDYASTILESGTVNSININNARLSHRKNTTSELYKMDVTVVDDVTISASGSIGANGLGYIIGYGDGVGGAGAYNDGAGGGAHGGAGGGGDNAANNSGLGGISYGSIINPVTLGSGAGEVVGSSNTNGDGGGALKLTIGGTLTNEGTISSNGLQGSSAGNRYGGGGGAGGSVWIITNTLSGNGTIQANGGNGESDTYAQGGGGGGGRVAIQYTTDSFTGAVEAVGGTAASGSPKDGAAGTICKRPAGQTYCDLFLDNGSNTDYEWTNIEAGSFHDMTIGNAILSHKPNTTTEAHTLNLQVLGDLVVDSDGKVSVSGRGYQSSAGPCAGTDGGDETGGGGGCYGGVGANGKSGVAGGTATYGNEYGPVKMGSGGGGVGYSGIETERGGAGGGIIRMAVSGTSTINGAIEANGGNGSNSGNDHSGGGGAGGSIWFSTNILTGSGSIYALGGNGASTTYAYGGGGGGGRVAIEYITSMTWGGNSLSASSATAGGSGGSSSAGYGTVFINNISPGVITNLEADLDALDSNWSTNLETNATQGFETVGLVDVDNNNRLAEVSAFINGDRDFGNVTGDSNTTKAFMHVDDGVGSQVWSAAPTYVLYIPYNEGDGAVMICPGATSLSEVTSSCAGGYVLTEDSDRVTIENVNGQYYWVVTEVSSTGGLGINTSGTPNMRVDLANEATSATDDVEMWFDTPTDITADSLIYLAYDPLFTGGADIGTSDVTVNCDDDGEVGGTTTEMTSATVVSSESGYLEIDVNTDTCSDWIQIDIHGGGGNSLTNPSSSGNYSWGVVTDVSGDGVDDDSGATLAYVGDDNDVNITAIVPPTIDMELYQQGTDTELTDTNTCALGVLSLNQVNTCIYDLGTGTNNSTGVSVYMTSDGSLDDGNGNSIGSPTGAVTSGEEEYGFYLSELGGGEYTAAGSYSTQHQSVPTSATLIASTSTTGSGTTVGSSSQHLEITHAASMSTSTIVGSYNQVVTYTAYTN